MSELEKVILELTSEEDLGSVQDLNLRSCNVTSSELKKVLPKLQQLRLLSLSHNLLTHTAGFELKHLCSLNLNHNSIDSLEGLGSCVSLQELYAANNSIQDLTPLSNLKNLTTVSVFKNAIASLDAYIRALHGLPLLHNLDLEGNPAAAEPNYRQRTVHGLPALCTLDGDLITPLERQAGMDSFMQHNSHLGRALNDSGPSSNSAIGLDKEDRVLKAALAAPAVPSATETSNVCDLISSSMPVSVSVKTSMQQEQGQQQQQQQQQEQHGQAQHNHPISSTSTSHLSSKPPCVPQPHNRNALNTASHHPSTQPHTTQHTRSRAASSISRHSDGGGSPNHGAGNQCLKSNKSSELWQPNRDGASVLCLGSWRGRTPTASGEGIPPLPKGSCPSTPGSGGGGVQLVSDELLNDHPLLLEYLAKHVLAAGLKNIQQGAPATGGAGGVMRARGSFAKRLRDAASAMAATEGLATHELASSSAIQAALPACTPSTTNTHMGIVEELVAAASPHELVRQLIKLSEVLIQEMNTSRRALSQASSSSSNSRPDSSQSLSSSQLLHHALAEGQNPGRPDKLAPLVSWHPSLGGCRQTEGGGAGDVQGRGSSAEASSSHHQNLPSGISGSAGVKGLNAEAAVNAAAGASQGGVGNLGRGALSKSKDMNGEVTMGVAQTQGELQKELEELRHEVKQLRIENRNVYWLDDECKRLRAELKALLQKQ